MKMIGNALSSYDFILPKIGDFLFPDRKHLVSRISRGQWKGCYKDYRN